MSGTKFFFVYPGNSISILGDELWQLRNDETTVKLFLLTSGLPYRDECLHKKIKESNSLEFQINLNLITFLKLKTGFIYS